MAACPGIFIAPAAVSCYCWHCPHDTQTTIRAMPKLTQYSTFDALKSGMIRKEAISLEEISCRSDFEEFVLLLKRNVATQKDRKASNGK